MHNGPDLEYNESRYDKTSTTTHSSSLDSHHTAFIHVSMSALMAVLGVILYLIIPIFWTRFRIHLLYSPLEHHASSRLGWNINCLLGP